MDIFKKHIYQPSWIKIVVMDPLNNLIVLIDAFFLHSYDDFCFEQKYHSEVKLLDSTTYL